jgi:two-component system OmpR family sensor kinase
MTIRNRLTLLYSSLLALVLIVFSMGLYWTLKYSLHQQIDSQLQARADEIQAGILLELGAQTSPVLENTLRDNGQDYFENPGIFVEFSDQQGNVTLRSPNLGTIVMPTDAAGMPSTQVWSTVTVEGQPVRLLSVPMTLPGDYSVVLRVGTSLAPVQQTLDWLALLLSIGTAIATVFAVVLGLIVSGRALSPIASMSSKARDIVEHKQLDTRLPVVNPEDELGQLAMTFNEALAQIEQLFQTQRRFVADAAHELRTPLTSIRGYVSLLKRGAWKDEEAREESLGVIDYESGRLTRLVNDLLLLAQSENKTLEIMERPVALLETVTSIVRQQERLSPTHKWMWQPADSPVIMGDADRLHQLILNLLDNARRHTPEGSQVTVKLAQVGANAVLSVTDTGPGIPPEMLPHLFEPFFRADSARNRQGTGLGLAIAQRLAEAHGGKIEATNHPDGGAQFTLTLPVPPEEKATELAVVSPRPAVHHA